MEEQTSIQGGHPVKGSALGQVPWSEVIRGKMLAAEKARARENSRVKWATKDRSRDV